jgi:hypothetical protein
VRETADGRLAYEVSPSGRAPTVFTSISLDDGGVVFENLQHDFPQRVAYQRKGEDLLAWIEGRRRTRPVSCAASTIRTARSPAPAEP